MYCSKDPQNLGAKNNKDFNLSASVFPFVEYQVIGDVYSSNKSGSDSL